MQEVIKQLALDAIDRTSLMDFCTGIVMQAKPLMIRLELGLELSDKFLLLSRNVTSHEERGQIRTWSTDEGIHWSEYRMIRDLDLKVGESVILLKANGGQQYLVLDRMGQGVE